LRPKPFIPEPLPDRPHFIRDKSTDLVWHQCENRTLYVDTDRSEVVYHANYLKFFEMGRASLMRETGYPYRSVEDDGYVYPIIEIGVQYHAPLFYDDPMLIHTRPGEKERVRLRFEYIITHGETGVLVCKGFTCHCALNKARKPVGIDPKTQRIWEVFPR